MARIAASEETRIRRLHQSLRRAVAQDMIGEVMGQKPFASLLGVMPSTLRPWLEDPEVAESGAFVPGGRGFDYKINPIATIWVLIRWFERKRDERVRGNLRVREMMVGDKLDNAPAEMTTREVREAMGLHLQLRELELQDGQLLSRSEVDATFSELVRGLNDAIRSAPQKQDPTSEWSPEFREKFDNVLVDLMAHLRQAGQDALSLDDGTVPAVPDGQDQRAPKRKAVRRSKAPRASGAGTASAA